MIINPQKAIDAGWVTGIASPKVQVQPNAIEFTMDMCEMMLEGNTFTINRDGKTHRGTIGMEPTQNRNDHRLYWHLSPGQMYDVSSNVSVDLPENVALLIIIRSTYSRNGMFLTSGLYDSGYKGPVGAALHNLYGESRIEVGERLGQAMFVTAESAGMYAGGYNHEAGTHWTDSK